MVRCIVYNCTIKNDKHQNKENKLHFYSLPKGDIRKKWLYRCGRNENDVFSKSFVCSKHFSNNMFLQNDLKYQMGFRNYPLLKEGAYPDTNLAIKTSNVHLEPGKHSAVDLG